MKDFDNRYVLSLVGIAFADGWLPLIVTPFMPNGNLLGYLRDPKNVSLSLKYYFEFKLNISIFRRPIYDSCSSSLTRLPRVCSILKSRNLSIEI